MRLTGSRCDPVLAYNIVVGAFMLVDILWTSVNAIFPVVLLIALGYFLRHIGFLQDGFIKGSKNLVFKVLLPCSLFVNIYSISGIGAIRWDVVIYSIVLILVTFAVGFVAGKFATKDPLRKGVVWQCAFRSNFAIIGLPLATALGGDDGAAVASVLSAFAIPLFNLCSVGALSFYTGGNGKKLSPVRFVIDVVKNPLTLGVLAGLFALLVRSLQGIVFGRVIFSLEREIPFLYKVLANLKSATTPLALLVLGGQCVFSAAKGMFRELAIGTVCRIIIAPLVAVVGAVLLSKFTNLLHCGNGEYAAIIALFGAPVAVSSAIVAGEMGNDEQLASQLVVWTSIGSLVTIFLFSCILMGTGLMVI